MGTVVHNNGPVDTICGHVRTSLTNSVARGGKFAEIAAVQIQPLHASIVSVDQSLVEATEAAATTGAVVTVAHDKAAATVRRVHDDTWNDIGRPRSDAPFELIFPSGSASYTDGDVETMPDRMELLARIFDKNLHPKLTPEQNKASAEKLRAAAAELTAALTQARLPAVNVALLGRTKIVMARSAQRALMGFKRSLKNAGYTEAEIHEVIPEFPKYAPKKPGKGGAKADAGKAKAATGDAKAATSDAKAGAGDAKAAAREEPTPMSQTG